MAGKGLNTKVGCRNGCGIGCLAVLVLVFLGLLFVSLDQWNTIEDSVKTDTVIAFVVLVIILAVLFAPVFATLVFLKLRNKKQKRDLETQFVNVFEEYRRTPDDNEEIKNQLVTLGKRLNKKYPEKYTKESLAQQLYEAECLHHETKYQQALTLLQNNPGNLTFRNQVRDLGKWLTQNYSEKFSEQSLTNDLMVCLSGHGDGGGGSGVAAEIQKLSVLYSKGLITQEEFERGKALFLGSPPDKAKKTLEALGSLYRLMKQGALSEAEFNMKKWDLLSGKMIQ